MKKLNWKAQLSILGLLLGWFVPTIILAIKQGNKDVLSLIGISSIMAIALFLLAYSLGKSLNNK